VQCKPTERGTVKDIADIFHGKIIDVSFQNMTLELQGREEKMIAAQVHYSFHLASPDRSQDDCQVWVSAGESM
jgi:hypothetical protein